MLYGSGLLQSKWSLERWISSKTQKAVRQLRQLDSLHQFDSWDPCSILGCRVWAVSFLDEICTIVYRHEWSWVTAKHGQCSQVEPRMTCGWLQFGAFQGGQLEKSSLLDNHSIVNMLGGRFVYFPRQVRQVRHTHNSTHTIQHTQFDGQQRISCKQDSVKNLLFPKFDHKKNVLE